MQVEENVDQIGSITIFLNTERNGRNLLPYGVETEVVADVVALVDECIKHNPWLAERVQIRDVRWSRGCLQVKLELIAIGIGIYTFVKDYPDLRKGLQLLRHDLKKVTIVVKQTGEALHGLIYCQTMITLEEMKGIIKKRKDRITQVTARLIDSVSPKYVLPATNEKYLEAIAKYITNSHVIPAMATKNKGFSVASGRVKEYVPAGCDITDLCTILGSEALEKRCGIRRTNISGQVNTPDMIFTYNVINDAGAILLPYGKGDGAGL